MEAKNRSAVATLVFVFVARSVFAVCAVERLPVKTVTDSQASLVSQIPLPASIESLHSLPVVRPLPHASRIAPAETTTYSVTATLIAYRLTPQSDVHLVLSDDARRTIVATIPSLACIEGSRFRFAIESARSEFERRYTATPEFVNVRQPVEVQGVGFFDFFQSQRGSAPNGLSLHPVTAIDFTPAFSPKPPPASPSRRRAVGSGGSRCTPPSLTMTTSASRACAGQQATIAWQASDAAARVTIDGIGTSLPASGTRAITANAATIYSGRAITSCATSDEAVALLDILPAADAAVSGPPSVTAGSTASISVNVSGIASWTISSSLGNAINPSVGSSSRAVTYSATRIGSDTLTLRTSGGCTDVARTMALQVSSTAPPPPPPPPPATGLLCCDGTRSPTCFSCSNKRGCCSSHGGVCGC